MTPSKTADHSLVIIGAGAAGIGASNRATELGIDHVVLEASHRIGGRGLTEVVEGAPVDLGCHWMHSASRNPLVALAEKHGARYDTDNPPLAPFENGCWQQDPWRIRRENEIATLHSAAIKASGTSGNPSLWSLVDETFEHVSWLGYWLGLMHSADADQTAVSDISDYIDTGEDWPVTTGYGALIESAGRDIPRQLNTPVRRVRYQGPRVTLETDRGTVTADRALVTVSTGILGAGDIRFAPDLPDWKQQAIHDLPLGNANYAIYHLPDHVLADAPGSVGYVDGDTAAALQVRPGGQPFLVAATGGRFAWWLEKQGEARSRAWLDGILSDLFGHHELRGMGRFRASAWGYDPWVRGAYSAARPGSRDARKNLAEPVGGNLWFAGEAASTDQFSTAHGAWISGRNAVSRIAEAAVDPD